MNLKHEMFWNANIICKIFSCSSMNLKHEMFWNELKALGVEVPEGYEP